MVSSIKITKLNNHKSSAHNDNMVSAKNNVASIVTAVRLKKVVQYVSNRDVKRNCLRQKGRQ